MRVRSLSQEESLEGHGNPLQYCCLENPMDKGAWWAIVHRVSQSRTQLKQLSTHARTLWEWVLHCVWSGLLSCAILEAKQRIVLYKCTVPLGCPQNRMLADLVSVLHAATWLMLWWGVKKSKTKPLLALLFIFPFSEGWHTQMFSYLLEGIIVHHLWLGNPCSKFQLKTIVPSPEPGTWQALGHIDQSEHSCE